MLWGQRLLARFQVFTKSFKILHCAKWLNRLKRIFFLRSMISYWELRLEKVQFSDCA